MSGTRTALPPTFTVQRVLPEPLPHDAEAVRAHYHARADAEAAAWRVMAVFLKEHHLDKRQVVRMGWRASYDTAGGTAPGPIPWTRVAWVFGLFVRTRAADRRRACYRFRRSSGRNEPEEIA